MKILRFEFYSTFVYIFIGGSFIISDVLIDQLCAYVLVALKASSFNKCFPTCFTFVNYILNPSWTVNMCLFRFPDWVKALPHISQLYFCVLLTPSWTELMWALRFPFWLKVLPQVLHSKAFIPLWIALKCFTKFPFKLKTLPQNQHFPPSIKLSKIDNIYLTQFLFSATMSGNDI